MTATFSSIDSQPYPWPYDKAWSAENSALLCLDYQKDFCDRSGFLYSVGLIPLEREASLQRAARLLNWAREVELPVLHCRQIYHSKLLDAPAQRLAWGQKTKLRIGTSGPLGRYLIEGEAGSRIKKELSPVGDEPVFDRPAINPFLHSDLHNYLSKRGIRNLIIIGSLIEASVHAAVCAANDRGYEACLVKDACMTLNSEYAATVERTTILGGGLFGTVALSETVIQLKKPVSLTL